MLESMPKPKLYLDTSVPSAYLDERAPDRQRLTIEFWQSRLPDFEANISGLVLEEVRSTPDAHRRAAMARLVEDMIVLPYEPGVSDLAIAYVRRGVFAERDMDDAIHVAIAVTNDIRYLASWNFKHLVKLRTRQEVNLVNSQMGHGWIDILAPPEL
jgi:predicted nucleic acid-binding protein